jgi:hypothetical protein
MPEQVEDTENFNATKDCNSPTAEPPGLTQTDLALGQLAFLLAFANALGKRRRRRLVSKLNQISEDWSRPGRPPGYAHAAEHLVRPATRMISPAAPKT